MSIYLLFK